MWSFFKKRKIRKLQKSLEKILSNKPRHQKPSAISVTIDSLKKLKDEALILVDNQHLIVKTIDSSILELRAELSAKTSNTASRLYTTYEKRKNASYEGSDPAQSVAR